MTDHFSPLAAMHSNLKRLLVIRVIVFICQLLALFYARFVLDLLLPYAAITGIFILFIVINVSVFLRLLHNKVVSDPEFLIHLLMDIFGLTVLLYLAGGASNPFVSYFLVPVTIAAAILPSRYTWIIASAGLACYSLLLFFYLPLPEVMPMAMEPTGELPGLHVIGMWLNFLVSAALITYFVVKMAAEIRLQEDKLTRYREDNLRNEQILAVATQAAGTAHELGTPLSTAAILLNDMKQDHADDSKLTNNLAILQDQIAICKDTLRKLVHQADFRSYRQPQSVPLTDFVRQVLSQWQLLRPEVKLVNQVQSGDAPTISVEAVLPQAIINLLNNAADASPRQIDVSTFWDSSIWGMQIRDHGEGLNREILEQIGTGIISTKQEGLGVGLMLSQASIDRLGGSVSLFPHQERGTVTELRLPLPSHD